MTTRDQIVAEARTWLGTPWVHQHRAKGIATDCAGLVIGVARSLGLVSDDFDVPAYGRQPNGTMLDLCAAHMTRISQHAMQPGDVVIVAIDVDPQHMGIVVPYRHGGLAMVHATSVARRGVVETRLMFAANLKFMAAYRLPGVDA
jgi:cell wall-associated NlpC family hydrolase